MTNTIRLKRSTVAAKVPLLSDLQVGELALNIPDRKLYSSNGTTVFELGGAVTSVAGKVGVVTLTPSDVGLGNVPNIDATNASNLTTGTLADTRLSSNVVFLTGAQTLTGSKTFSSITTISNTTASTTTSTGALVVTGGVGVGGTITAGGFSGSLSGNASTATTLQTARTIGISGGATGTATSFNGSANITIPVTDLNASLLSSGTVPDDRISGSYTGLVNLTGSGSVDFSYFLGTTSDTVTAPSFTWTGDTNTGIYHPGADQIAFALGGTNSLTLRTTGTTSNYDLYITTLGDVNADSTNTLRSSGVLYFRSKFWNGTTSVNHDWNILNTISSTAPLSQLSFRIGTGTMMSINSNGVLSANSFSGSGSSLTGLNASNISSGTVADARLSNNVVLTTGSQTITGEKTFSGITSIINATDSTSTGVGALVVNGGISAAGIVRGASFIGSLSGNATSATTLQTARTIGLSGGATGTATSFNGSANITIPVTDLNASNLTSGTVAPARLGTGTPAANTILFGDGRWALAPAADNLGNHTATTTLNMNGQAIDNVNGLYIRSSSYIPFHIANNSKTGAGLSTMYTFFNMASGNAGGTGQNGFYIYTYNGVNFKSIPFTILDNDNVGISTLAPAYTLDVSGSFRATGSVLFSNTTGSTSATTGAVVISGGLGVSGSTYLGGSLLLDSGGAVNTGIEIGSRTGNSTPFIDFHSGATYIDYDTRIVGTGGNGTIGQGTLTFAAASSSFSGSITTTFLSAQRTGAVNIALSTANNSNCQIEVRSGGSDAAYISFHRPGIFASNFGLDSDNQFAFGGWSYGNAFAGIKAGAGTFTGALNLSTGEFMNINNGSGWRYTRFRSGTTQYFDVGLDTSSNYFISRWPDGGGSPITFNINRNTGATTVESLYLSGDTSNRFTLGRLILRATDPTIVLRATDHRTTTLHCNSNYFYVLSAPADSESYAQIGGAWPLQINLTNNDAVFGRNTTLAPGDGNGYAFWGESNINSGPNAYKIYMSATNNATWGGRLDSTSDYNMYFRMTQGTNRGWVFHNGASSVAQIDASGNLYLNSHLMMGGVQVIDAGGGWVRTYGNTGWYNGTHGGGMWMNESSTVRTYGGKNLYSEGQLGAGGPIGFINGIYPANGAIRLTPNMHLNAGSTTHAVIVNWDSGNAGGTASDLMFQVGNGASLDVFNVNRSGTAAANIMQAATTFQIGADTSNRFIQGGLILRSVTPTITFRDTDHNSAMIHCNSNRLYVLRGGVDTESWTAVNGAWPVEINLTNNDTIFGGNITTTKVTAISLSNQISLGTTGSTANNKRWDINVFNGDGNLYWQTMTDANAFIANAAYITRAGVFVCTSVSSTSDVRLKKDITPIRKAIEIVSKLNPIFYKWKEELPQSNGVEQMGFIAQEVELVVPSVVFTGSDEAQTKSVDYTKLIPILTKAIQEQQHQIEVMQTTIQMLMKKLQG